MTWLCLLELIWDATSLAARGHRWVAAFRLFGFNVFRNTYKPLFAETIVNFWNRLLLLQGAAGAVFLLSYLSTFFSRLAEIENFAAVFAAAFVGNLYYHFLQMKNPLMVGYLAEVAEGFIPRMIYCLFSQLGLLFHAAPTAAARESFASRSCDGTFRQTQAYRGGVDVLCTTQLLESQDRLPRAATGENILSFFGL